MKSLLSYLKQYRKQCILAPLFKMLEASFELFVPLVVAAIIDDGIGNGDKHVVVMKCLILLALAAVGLVSAITAQYFAARAATGFATGVRHALFKRLQSLSYSDMDTMGTSAMLTRMTSDVNQTQQAVNLTLRLFLRSPFVVFGAMVMAFTIDVRCALIFVGVIAALSVVVFGIMAINVPMLRNVQSALEKVLGATRENLTGARVIRAFCKEESQFADFVEKNGDLYRKQKAAGRVSGLMNPLTYILINLAIVYLIKTGAVRVSQGSLTSGQVVALYNYMSQILVELVKLANLIVSMNKGFACWKRIETVLEQKSDMSFPEKADNSSEGSVAVAFENVSLRYKTAGDYSLENITFSVKKGETIGIIGGTGSGKTSLVNLIPRFYDATDGRVMLFGKDIKTYTEADLRARVSVVPQKAVLFKGTIAENLRWGKENATDAELDRAIEISQSADVVKAKGGINAEIEQQGSNLSGGQRQRLTIARALVGKPEILILDDSSSALDQTTDARLRKAIKQIGGTVFIVSQRTASVRGADKIIVLDEGRAVGIGTHDALMKSCPIYREIHLSQYREEDAV